MYEDGNSYDEILERTLDRVATDVDKREGSVIFNAIAPTTEEIAYIYNVLDEVSDNGFADTAEREYLILKCRERGITPYPATNAVLKGEFNMEIPLGNRFSLGDLNYSTVEFISVSSGKYYYQLKCEQTGTQGNTQFGELTAIDFISTDMQGSLIELLIPAEDEEETEDLRERYFDSFTATPFAGNQAAYKQEVGKLDGVGGVKVIPVWNGGGTVKVIIINSEYQKPSDTLVAAVQNEIDPTPQGTGTGIAPIGHTVTVVGCTAVTINIKTKCTFEDSYDWESVKDDVKTAIEAYLLDICKAWSTSNTSTIRVSQIENRILSVDGIVDVQNTTINNSSDNLVIGFEEIPVLGGIING